MPDKRYKAPNGKIVTEKELSEKYGDRLNSVLSEYNFTEINESVYKAPNGKLATESELREHYGDKFESVIKDNNFEINYTPKKKGESVSVSPYASTAPNQGLVSGTTDGSLGISEDRPTYNLEDKYRLSPEEWLEAQERGFAPPPSVEISLSRPKMDSSHEDYMNQSWEERQDSYTPFKESFVKSDNLKEKVGTGWKPETNEEKSEFSEIKSLDFQMKDLNIHHPYKYFSEANKSDYNDRDEFIENNFGYDNLISMGIDPVDFDGFINKKGYKEDFSDKESRGLFKSSDYSFDHNLAQEQERYRMLSLYIADMNKRAVLREKLNAEIESGTPVDMPDPVFIFNGEEVSNFIKNEFPIYSKVVEKRKEKEKEILQKHIDGEAGFWFRVGGMANRGWDMFAERINDISATTYDKIGFDTIADEIRYSKSQSELAKPNDRLVSYVSGKSGEHNGRKYLVDSKGRVIDSELKIDVTDVLDPSTYKDLMSKSKDWEDDWTLSGWGMATETAGVATDLIVQIAATAALSRVGIKPLPSAMIAQGALGYSQGLEDGMESAREYGLTESESAEFASSLAREMGAWYVLTSVISPQTKGADAMFGISKKKFMEDAVKAYSRTDKKALGRFVDNVAENYLTKRGIRNLAVDFNIEGAKETIQENIQQLGEVNIKQRANRISGQDILEAEDMTGDDIFNTTIISYIVGGIPSMLKFSSNRTTDKLLLLKSVNDSNVDVVGVLDNLEKEEVITNEFRREFEQDLKAYRNNINKIPDNLDSEIALEVLNSLERINELETKKESLDSAFHSEVDEEIKSEREKIINLTKRVKKEASKSESTTDTEVETEPSSSQSTALDSSETTTAQKPEAEEEVSDVKNKPETEEEISEAETDRDLEEVIGVSPDEVTDFDNVLVEEQKKLSELESKHGANHRLVKEQRAVVDALEKNAPISVSVENGKIVVKGRGSDNQKTRKEAIQKAIDEGVIDEIPPTNMEGANYADIDQIVARESHNPIEVATSLDNVRKEEKSKGRTVRTLDTARDAVLDYFASGGKISTNILQQLFGNKRGKNIQGEIQARLTLLSNSGPVTVDGLADEIWNLVGEELGITDSSEIRNEIEDVLLSFNTPKQMREELYGSDGKTPLEVELEMKFEELTGLNPNQSNIEMFFNRNREEDSNSNQDLLDDIPFQSTKETFKPISRRKLNQLVRGLQRAFKKAGKKVRVHTGAKKMADRLKQLAERGYNTPSMQHEYRMSHTAPTRDDGMSVSIDRLNEIYPDDVYSNMGWHYYGDGDRTMDKQSHAKLRSLKGKPDAKVTVYRAVPKGVTEIKDGDWITINRNYAVSHGESHIDGDYDIISLEVRADQVFTDANSLHEQGIQFLQTKDGTVYGFVDPVTGDIYMDGELMNANTPIHEFTHLWISSVQQTNPKLWERMVNVAKQTPEWKRLANDPNYKQGQFKEKKGKALDNAIADEVWATIIGNHGENNFEAVLEKMNGDRSLAQRVWDTVQDFWQSILDLFYDAGLFSGDVTLPSGVRLQASVFHGSPHSFDRFSTENIGTGEGAQAFGWGLYFTDLKSIASSYAKMGTKITVDGKEIYSNNRSMLYSLGVIPVEQDLAYNSLIANFGNVDMAIKALRERGNTELINNAISILNNSNIEVSGNRNLYSVTLHKGKTPDQYTWLEWDKKFSELPQNTREALLKLQEVDKIHGTAVNLEVKDYTIEHFYKMLSQSLGSPQAASLFLLENGIDGIKYPAESIARGATSDNARGFNYVVFDENAVTIEEHTRFQQGNQNTSDQSLQNPEVAAIADMALGQMMSGEFGTSDPAMDFAMQYASESELLRDANGNVIGVKPEVLEEIRKEREQIETEARANGTWMKAPNGENTNLNEAQAEKSRAEKFLDLLDSWENDINQFGKETMGVNIPVVVAKGMIRMMRIAVKGGMNITQAFNAGMDYIRETDWYKKLSETDKAKVEAKTFRTVITNAVRQAIDAENKLNKIREKLNELTKETEVEKPKTKDKRVERAEKEKRVRQEVVNDLVHFLSKNKIDGKITPTEVNRLIKYASRIATDSNAQKAFDRFMDAFIRTEVKASRRRVAKDVSQRATVIDTVEGMLNKGVSESDILNSFNDVKEREIANEYLDIYRKMKSNPLKKVDRKDTIPGRLRKRFKKFQQKWFANQGGILKPLMDVLDDSIGKRTLALRHAKHLIKEFEREIKKLNYSDLDTFSMALSGNKDAFDSLPDSLKNIVSEMRLRIDGLQQKLIDSGSLTSEQALEIQKSIGSYVSRTYEYFYQGRLRRKIAKNLFGVKGGVSKQAYEEAMNFIAQRELANMNKNPAFNHLSVEDKAELALEEAERQIADYISSLEEEHNRQSSDRGKDISPLKHRKEIPSPIRKLLGEHTDPRVQFIMTIARLSNLVYQHEMLMKVRDLGIGNLFYEQNDPARPSEYSVKLAPEGSSEYSPLNGLYTTSEFKEAFMGVQNNMSDLARLWAITTGGVKYGLTILSPITHGKNFFGNIGFLILNGLYDVRGFQYSARLFYDSVLAGETSRNEFIELLISKNILDKSTVLNEVKSDISDTFEKDLLRRINGKSVIKKGLRIPFLFAENVYQASDDFFKAYSFYNELNSYSQAYFGVEFKDLPEGSDRDFIISRASEVTKNTLANYNRVYKGGQQPRKSTYNLVGNFLSFKAESIRTFINAFQYAKEDMSDPRTRSVGMRRMAGIVSYLSLRSYLSYMAAKMSGMAVMGIWSMLFDDEEGEEEMRRDDFNRLSAPWTVDQEKIYKENPDGTYSYYVVDVDPYQAIFHTLNAASNKGVGGAVKELTEPFIGPELSAKALLNMVYNKDEYGREIGGDMSRMLYLSRQLSPGIVKEIIKMTDDDPNNDFEWVNLLGVKKYELDPTKILNIKSNNFLKSYNDLAGKNFYITHERSNGGWVEKDQISIVDEYVLQENKKEMRKLLENFVRDYEAAVRLGADTRKFEENIRKKWDVKYIKNEAREAFFRYKSGNILQSH